MFSKRPRLKHRRQKRGGGGVNVCFVLSPLVQMVFLTTCLRYTPLDTMGGTGQT